MELDEASDLAYGLLGEFGLTDWTFQFDQAVRRFGQCSYQLRRITLSAPLTELNDEEEVQNTLLHEIAHALAGRKAGHGPLWKKVARDIGCTATRCHDAVTPQGEWVGTCPCCCKQVRRHRQSERMYRLACRLCCRTFNHGNYTTDFLLQWEKEL